MISDSTKRELIELTEQHSDNMKLSPTIQAIVEGKPIQKDRTIPIEFNESPATRVHLSLGNACADSAIFWRERGVEALKREDIHLAIFCQQCAWDNERIAEEERGLA